MNPPWEATWPLVAMVAVLVLAIVGQLIWRWRSDLKPWRGLSPQQRKFHQYAGRNNLLRPARYRTMRVHPLKSPQTWIAAAGFAVCAVLFVFSWPLTSRIFSEGIGAASSEGLWMPVILAASWLGVAAWFALVLVMTALDLAQVELVAGVVTDAFSHSDYEQAPGVPGHYIVVDVGKGDVSVGMAPSTQLPRLFDVTLVEEGARPSLGDTVEVEFTPILGYLMELKAVRRA